MAKTADKDSGDILAFEDGAFLFKEGDPSRELYIVQEGEVELLGQKGKKTLARLGPGEPLGELAVLEQGPRECTARAAGPCRVLKIDPQTFAGLLKEPSVVAPLLRRLSRRLFAALAAPPEPAVPVELRRPRFVHAATGMEFPVPPSGDAVVGRADPKSGFKPEIELSGADPKRSLSRKHARVSIREGAVFVSEESRVSNGTFVNGARLKAGASLKLAPEDRVRFGLVETVFKLD